MCALVLVRGRKSVREIKCTHASQPQVAPTHIWQAIFYCGMVHAPPLTKHIQIRFGAAFMSTVESNSLAAMPKEIFIRMFSAAVPLGWMIVSRIMPMSAVSLFIKRRPCAEHNVHKTSCNVRGADVCQPQTSANMCHVLGHLRGCVAWACDLRIATHLSSNYGAHAQSQRRVGMCKVPARCSSYCEATSVPASFAPSQGDPW